METKNLDLSRFLNFCKIYQNILQRFLGTNGAFFGKNIFLK